MIKSKIFSDFIEQSTKASAVIILNEINLIFDRALENKLGSAILSKSDLFIMIGK